MAEISIAAIVLSSFSIRSNENCEICKELYVRVVNMIEAGADRKIISASNN